MDEVVVYRMQQNIAWKTIKKNSLFFGEYLRRGGEGERLKLWFTGYNKTYGLENN